MIKYIKGDLFSSNIKIKVHGCNNQGVMGSGVAAIVRRDYPEAYKAYVERHKFEHWQLGEIQAIETNGSIIVNAITQNLFGRDNKRYVSYDAIVVCMEKLIKMFPNETAIAMPAIGAGLGGGDWRIIEKIIDSTFEGTGIQPYVYYFDTNDLNGVLDD